MSTFCDEILGGLPRARRRSTSRSSSPLAGKLFDESGEPLYVQGAAKGERRYRYYVSRTLVRGNAEGTEQGWRISAPELEQRVAESRLRLEECSATDRRSRSRSKSPASIRIGCRRS